MDTYASIIQSIDDLEQLRIASALFNEADYFRVPSLFHYTAAENANKIIHPRFIDFRLTRADCFADKNEGKHIVSVFLQACGECFQKGVIDRQYYNILISAAGKYRPVCAERYVLCFSKKENSRYLIENYACCQGKREGICVGVHAINVEDLEFELPMNLYDVVYDDKVLLRQMQILIMQMYQLRSQDRSGFLITESIVIMQLLIYGLVYKHPDYSNEEETRLLLNLSEADTDLNCIRKDQTDPEHYVHLLLPKTSLYHLFRYDKNGANMDNFQK